jgi:hypothetical protein
MPTPPTITQMLDYLGDSHSWDTPVVQAALDAETAAQARIVSLPADPNPLAPLAYPADLSEALYRRVAHNLAVRSLPLGVQATMSEMAVSTTRVGGADAEVRRLEAPWRRLVVG